jgi:hypothetical protein
MTKATRSLAKFRRLYRRDRDEGEIDNYADKQMQKVVEKFKHDRQVKYKYSTMDKRVLRDNLEMKQLRKSNSFSELPPNKLNIERALRGKNNKVLTKSVLPGNSINNNTKF